MSNFEFIRLKKEHLDTYRKNVIRQFLNMISTENQKEQIEYAVEGINLVYQFPGQEDEQEEYKQEEEEEAESEDLDFVKYMMQNRLGPYFCKDCFDEGTQIGLFKKYKSKDTLRDAYRCKRL